MCGDISAVPCHAKNTRVCALRFNQVEKVGIVPKALQKVIACDQTYQIYYSIVNKQNWFWLYHAQKHKKKQVHTLLGM